VVADAMMRFFILLVLLAIVQQLHLLNRELKPLINCKQASGEVEPSVPPKTGKLWEDLPPHGLEQ
jgi:hypothetical protein